MDQKQEDNFIRNSLETSLQCCKKVNDTCPFSYDGYCYVSGERQDPQRVECE